nr:penicillin-binding transpeptidase domain-containing protein [Marinibactrum halimedae]
MAALGCVIGWHLASIQVLPGTERGYEFLQHQGQARTLRSEKINAYRGLITDRNGVPMAVSTPLSSLWVNPQILNNYQDRWGELAKNVRMKPAALADKLRRYQSKSFMYLSRHLPPAEAAQVLDLRIPGVYAQEEYRRFYPSAEVSAHLVGFTDVDDQGQEGVELAFDDWLSGESGAKHVVKDQKGHTIKEVGLVKSAEPGKSLRLSVDMRLQYLAYRALKQAVADENAKSASAVVLDTRTGEVLAMVNQPSYNPNNRRNIEVSATRNRAITDQFEPGSTMKPFSVMAAMEAGVVTRSTTIDTTPGYVHIGGKTFLDPVNYGVMDLTKIITKSSQVGTTKVAMKMDPNDIRDMYFRVGLGQSPGTGFPGEAVGQLPSYNRWAKVVHANYSFGYGFTASALQLAQAYSVIANDGVKKPVSLLQVESEPSGDQVIPRPVTQDMKSMLATVTEKGGTGTRAALEHYKTAGKSGTAHMVGKGGYADDRYRSFFAGFAPLDDPRIVVVVTIQEPRSGKYFGGEVAAPVFGKIAEGALRVLNVAPDAQVVEEHRTAKRSQPSGQPSFFQQPPFIQDTKVDIDRLQPEVVL